MRDGVSARNRWPDTPAHGVCHGVEAMSWVRRGVVCECIDDAWTDILSGESYGPAPVAGRTYVVAEGSNDFLRLSDAGLGDFWYEARAFRPVPEAEVHDLALFRALLKASAAPARTPELV